MSGDVFGGHYWECSWHLEGRSQSCCSTPYNSRDNPCNKELPGLINILCRKARSGPEQNRLLGGVSGVDLFGVNGMYVGAQRRVLCELRAPGVKARRLWGIVLQTL